MTLGLVQVSSPLMIHERNEASSGGALIRGSTSSRKGSSGGVSTLDVLLSRPQGPLNKGTGVLAAVENGVSKGPLSRLSLTRPFFQLQKDPFQISDVFTASPFPKGSFGEN